VKKRVGVFVCDCGTNIASVVDTEKVAAAARQFPGVVFATTYKYMCTGYPGGLISTRFNTQVFHKALHYGVPAAVIVIATTIVAFARVSAG
jgi:heterodisulfide reductase subunit A-like polyferredoxin